MFIHLDLMDGHSTAFRNYIVSKCFIIRLRPKLGYLVQSSAFEFEQLDSYGWQDHLINYYSDFCRVRPKFNTFVGSNVKEFLIRKIKVLIGSNGVQLTVRIVNEISDHLFDYWIKTDFAHGTDNNNLVIFLMYLLCDFQIVEMILKILCCCKKIV